MDDWFNRRTFCGMAFAMPAIEPCTWFELRPMIVHLRQALDARAYRVGEVIHDTQCRRHFLVTKVLETPTCRLAKAQWVVRAART